MTRSVESIRSQFESLYAGESSLEALMDSVIGQLQSGAVDPAALESFLNEERHAGRITPQIYQIIGSAISRSLTDSDDRPTVMGHRPVSSSVPEDQTQVIPQGGQVAVSPKPSPEATRIAESAPVSDALTQLDQEPKVRDQTKTIELKPGVLLKDQYVIESTLGAGGMGLVFKARDLLMEEMKDREPYVAIKVLRPEYQGDQQLLISLQREFRKAQKLSHPNIVGMMDFTRDQASGAVFITMQYLKGRTLGDLIQEKFPNGMPLEKALPIIRGMASALDYAHRQNIIHLDFKPGNVFVCENGDVKVLDFGIAGAGDAKTADQEKTVFNALDLGALTPSYASLEMIEHHSGVLGDYQPDPRDDVYALGCVVYELLTGRHPFGKASAKDASRSGLIPKEPSSLSKPRWTQLRRAIAFQRADRLESVESLLKAFEPFALANPKILGAIAMTSVVTIAAFQWLQQPPAECQSPVISAADQQKISDLLEVAAVDMDVGYLTSPPASNAMLAYKEVLKLDPCHLDAIGGLEKIAAAIEQEAWAAFESGNRELSLEKVTDGLNANPHHEGLLSLKSKLTQGAREK